MDPAVMLTLASIIYRGCELNLSDPAARKRARDAMVKCLQTFDKVKNKWVLVWGPTGFSPSVAGLDISAMYVARQVADPSQFAVVVRGTNLFSLIDWASNVLIEQRPWPYAAPATPAAMVSHSTALGLSFLQRLLSASPDANGAQTANLWSRAGEWITSHAARFDFNLLNLAAGLKVPPVPEIFAPIAQQINRLTNSGLSQVELQAVQRFAAAIASNRAQPIDETALLKQVESEQQNIAGGISLVDFLRGCVESGGPHLDVYVTGHSKGGPLAVALATWLADTQAGGDPAEQWDKDHHAAIHSYTFAAPTPGNETFANHFQSLIGDRYRLFNPDDLVPHVWKVDEAQQIPALYSGQLAFLSGVVEGVVPILEGLKYQHEAPATAWTPLPSHSGDLIEQIKFNHLDAYLSELGILGGDLCFEKLFEPLP